MPASVSPSPESGRRRRLPSSAFDPIFTKATVVPGRFLLLRIVRSPDGLTRWGFAVSRRAFRSAVDRNRIRRRLRAAGRDLEPGTPMHIVVVVRANALHTPFRHLSTDLRRLLRAGESRLNA